MHHLTRFGHFYIRPEKKHDYHIMLTPTTKQRAEKRAHDNKQSLSAYIEQTLINDLDSYL